MSARAAGRPAARPGSARVSRLRGLRGWRVWPGARQRGPARCGRVCAGALLALGGAARRSLPGRCENTWCDTLCSRERRAWASADCSGCSCRLPAAAPCGRAGCSLRSTLALDVHAYCALYTRVQYLLAGRVEGMLVGCSKRGCFAVCAPFLPPLCGACCRISHGFLGSATSAAADRIAKLGTLGSLGCLSQEVESMHGAHGVGAALHQLIFEVGGLLQWPATFIFLQTHVCCKSTLCTSCAHFFRQGKGLWALTGAPALMLTSVLTEVV